MGNSNDRGRGHWTDSPNVLRDTERIRTRPMPSPSTTPTPSPIDVTAQQAHLSVTTGEGSRPIGGGFSVNASGPNAHVGGMSTDQVGRLDAQANLGGIGISHSTDDHHYAMSVNAGIGGGVRAHYGEMPGLGGDFGPFSFDVRDRRFNQPSSEQPPRDQVEQDPFR